MRKLFLSLAVALPAFAGYGYQGVITLGNSSQIPASQSNFTVLVCANMTLGDGNGCPTVSGLAVTGSGGHATSLYGYDIVFSSTACSSPTLMNWEMPTYVGSTGAMEAWVLVPSLTASGSFYLCVGNSAISAFQGGATGAAWDSNYVSIWHLPNGSTLSLADSSANADTGTNGGVVTAAAGQIDGGANLPATTNSVVMGAKTVNTSPGTVSLWMYVPTLPGAASTIGGFQQGYVGGACDKILYLDAANKLHFYAYNGSSQITSTPSAALSQATWTYVVGSVGASGEFAYINGAQVGTNANTGSYASYTGADISLGNACSGAGGALLAFSADEYRVSTTQRSANWIATEYNNQSAPSSFLTVGSLTTVGASAKRRIVVVN
jgi:hypothetical protein